MSTAPLPQFLLLWKGRHFGPYSVAAIRDMLHSGEISRMHQILYNNRWMLLDEFLEKHGAGDPEAQRRKDAEKREAQQRRHLERQLAQEQAQPSAMGERLAPPLSQLLPPSVSSPAPASPPPFSPQPPLPTLPSAPFTSTPDAYFKNPQFLAIVGSALLLFGAFTPVVSIPQGIGLTFLKLGWPAYIVVGLAFASLGVVFTAQSEGRAPAHPTPFASLGVVFTAQWQALWVTGGGAALVLLGCLGAFIRRLYDAKDQIRAAPGQNEQAARLGEALGNLASDTIQLQWGCFILAVGVLLILAAAYFSSKSSPSPSELSL